MFLFLKKLGPQTKLKLKTDCNVQTKSNHYQVIRLYIHLGIKTIFHSAKKSEQTENSAKIFLSDAQFKDDCAISENRAEKVGGKKVENIQLSWRIF